MKSVARSLKAGLVVALLIPFGLKAQDAGDPPDRVGRISSLLGTVSFQGAGLNDWSVASLNYTVTTGDRLLTNQRARAEMEVGPFAVRLADSTDMNVVNLTDHFAQLGLSQGTLRVSVYRVARGDSMEVDTPNGAVVIRSAGQYRIDVAPNGRTTLVTVDDGDVELSGPGLDLTMRRGQTAELSGDNQIHATFVKHPFNTDFDTWSADRDRREEASDCSRYLNRDIPGCADLSDQGRWDEHPVYGRVWYPRHVVQGWVPYRYGRWVWVSPWGWTWVEDEPWGFAPFHYGRWVMINSVWGWAPGPIVVRPCYSPAFVTFVGGPRYGFGVGIGLHAWFPLGPREPYYPWYRHGDRYLRNVNYANVRNVTNINIFIDRGRAEHIDYQNRGRGTTIVSTETFIRSRPVYSDVVNVRSDMVARAPVVRNPWGEPERNDGVRQGHREVAPVASRPVITSDRRQDGAPRTAVPRDVQRDVPREATGDATREPVRPATREAQPRERTPLVSRNAPPTERPRTSDPSPRQQSGEVSRPSSADQTPSRIRPPAERPVISRSEQQPTRTLPSEGRERPTTERPVISRSQEQPTRTLPSEGRERAAPQPAESRQPSERSSAPESRGPTGPTGRSEPQARPRTGPVSRRPPG